MGGQVCRVCAVGCEELWSQAKSKAINFTSEGAEEYRHLKIECSRSTV